MTEKEIYIGLLKGEKVFIVHAGKDNSGKVGTFGRHDELGQVTPSFVDFANMIPWMRRNGFRFVAGTNQTPAHYTL